MPLDTIKFVPTRYPLSFNQLGIWLACAADPESSAYNMAYACDIQGEVVNVGIIRECFQELQVRHEMLRTTYLFAGDQPWQLIQESVPLDFEEVNASGHSEEEMARLTEGETRRPFDLEKGPVSRIRLYQRGRSDYRLLWVIHHMAADFWAIKILQNELWTLYLARTASIPCELPRLGAPYVEYVGLQSQMLLGDEWKAHHQYWREQLAGELPILNLPGDSWKRGLRSFRGESNRIQISPEITEGVRRLCKQSRLSLFSVLFSAYQSLLHDCSGQSDILIGTATLGWRRHAFRTIVGNFVNIVPIRTRLLDDSSLTNLASRASRLALDAIRHQGFPFPLMVKEFYRSRGENRSPLIQTLFMFQSLALLSLDEDFVLLSKRLPQPQSPRVWVSPRLLPQQEGQFELAIQVCETVDRFVVDFRYDTDCLSREMVLELGQSFERILANWVQDSADAKRHRGSVA